MTNVRRTVWRVSEQRVATSMKLEHSRSKYCADSLQASSSIGRRRVLRLGVVIDTTGELLDSSELAENCRLRNDEYMVLREDIELGRKDSKKTIAITSREE